MRGLPFLAMALAIATPAWSDAPRTETKTGSRLPVKIDGELLEIAKVREVQQRFAECVVKRHYLQAVGYLLMHPGVPDKDPQKRRLIGAIADPDCLTKAIASADSPIMEMPGDTMRYALADVLVRREFASTPLSGLDRVASLPHPVFDPTEYQPEPGKKASSKQLAELTADRNKEVARIYMSEFGECVVRLDPAKAYALLMTGVNTPAEKMAFQSLLPRFRECIVQGQTLTLGKALVRGTLAYNYYRLARAPRAVLPASQGSAK